jgi:glycosyltransferase involved in cell wall biosynthesis
MVARSGYEIVVAEFSVMGQYLYRNPFLPAVRRVISCHSCLTTALEKAIRLQPHAPASWLRSLLLHRLEAYEFGLYRSADLVLTLTAEEQADLLRREPSLRIAVAPYGVDAHRFRPVPSAAEAEESIVFTGYFSQEPNRDAVHWFVRTVWPELSRRRPELRFYVVGQGAGPDLVALAKRDPSIVVTGEVEDVLPYLVRARAYVCPMRLGTGFRGKLLQAMAAGVPVVATTLSTEGIPAHTGDSILLADTPRTILEALSLLLEDPLLRRRIADRARRLVEQRFAWERCVDQVEKALLSVYQ